MHVCILSVLVLQLGKLETPVSWFFFLVFFNFCPPVFTKLYDTLLTNPPQNLLSSPQLAQP